MVLDYSYEDIMEIREEVIINSWIWMFKPSNDQDHSSDWLESGQAIQYKQAKQSQTKKNY